MGEELAKVGFRVDVARGLGTRFRIQPARESAPASGRKKGQHSSVPTMGEGTALGWLRICVHAALGREGQGLGSDGRV